MLGVYVGELGTAGDRLPTASGMRAYHGQNHLEQRGNVVNLFKNHSSTIIHDCSLRGLCSLALRRWAAASSIRLLALPVGTLLAVGVALMAALLACPDESDTYIVAYSNHRIFFASARSMGLRIDRQILRSLEMRGPEARDHFPRLSHADVFMRELMDPTKRVMRNDLTSWQVLSGWPLYMLKYTQTYALQVNGGIAIRPRVVNVLWHASALHQPDEVLPITLKALPATPIIFGSVVNIAVWSLFSWLGLCVAATGMTVLLSRRRLRKGRCPACAYPLISDDVTRSCPECGLRALGGASAERSSESGDAESR